MKSTFGEILFATVLAGVAAAFAAVASLIGVIYLYAWLMGDRIWAAGITVGVGFLLLMPLVVFILVFWKIIHYGAPDSLPSSK